MKIRSLVTSKRYVKKIYLWVAISMILVLVTFAAVFYFVAQNDTMSNELNTNTKILNQIKFNINYMDEMIVNLCFTAYYNSDVKNLMENDNIEYADILANIKMIKTSLVNTNPYIKSVYIYNRQAGACYTTYNQINYSDADLEDLIKSCKQVPRLVPIYRKLRTPDGAGPVQNVFTYFIYQTVHSEGDMDRAVIINCNADWLIGNINELNNAGEKKQNEIFIMDEKGEFIGNTSNDGFNAAIKLGYLNYLKKSPDKTMGIFKCDLEGRDYLVTFTNATNANWVLLKIQACDQVFEGINAIRNGFILITLVLVFLAVLISLQVTRSIYNPINKLLIQMKSFDIPIDEQTAKDEISYMKQVYASSFEQIKRYKQQKDSEKAVIKAYFLKKLLADSYRISREEFDRMKREQGIAISASKPFRVCLVKIDDFKRHQEKYNEEDRALYSFAIVNVITEALSDSFPVEAVESVNDGIAILLNTEDGSDEICGRIKERIGYGQEVIYKDFGISISASVSGCADGIKELTRSFNEAAEILSYRLVYGKKSVITPDMVASNRLNRETEIEAALKRSLIQGIKIGNMKNIREAVDGICAGISEFSRNSIILALMQLINIIKSTIDEINLQRLEPVYMDSNFLAREVLSTETVEELKTEIIKVLEDAVDKSGQVEHEKHRALTNTVKEIIGANYPDSGLYLAAIAAKLNLSAKYVGRVFKAVAGMSVDLNDVRLGKAIEWLNYSKLSIHEIIPKVGIENESYFYKLFKTKYGVTPREYIAGINSKKIS